MATGEDPVNVEDLGTSWVRNHCQSATSNIPFFTNEFHVFFGKVSADLDYTVTAAFFKDFSARLQSQQHCKGCQKEILVPNS